MRRSVARDGFFFEPTVSPIAHLFHNPRLFSLASRRSFRYTIPMSASSLTSSCGSSIHLNPLFIHGFGLADP